MNPINHKSNAMTEADEIIKLKRLGMSDPEIKFYLAIGRGKVLSDIMAIEKEEQKGNNPSQRAAEKIVTTKI